VDETVSPADARALLLQAQGLCDDPPPRATVTAVERLIARLGFVQVDSINRVERAHHLILGTRLRGYRPALLQRAAFERRALFEHWTHDAAYIPVTWFAHWKPRFAQREARIRRARWFKARLGNDPDATLARVHARIEREGALRARDFEKPDDHASGWWNWSPEKTALEVLWHTGRLAIAGRERFDKIYDLVERVLPEAHRAPEPARDAHVDWACQSALERLVTATPSELRDFWGSVTPAEAAAWCRAALAAGGAVPVMLASANGGKPRRGVALPDWQRRARRAPRPERTHLLAPFDPVLRDRKRLERLFAFDYRFEAYTPAAKRRFGYYVLPILEGDRLVGRLDPRHDRERESLVVERIWWEARVKPTRARVRALDAALEELAERIGARKVEVTRRKSR
jgi:hypothetical protein